MSLLGIVEVPRRPVSLLEPIIGGPRYRQLVRAAGQVRQLLAGRTMVNALQRHATVIAQKSLAEGFGLTVSEGMWKGRPVIGSAVGGIIDQIAEGTGLLLPDPADLQAFGKAVRLLLGDQAETSPARAGRARLCPRELPRGHPPDALRQAARHAYRGWLAVKAMPFRHAAQPPHRIPRQPCQLRDTDGTPSHPARAARSSATDSGSPRNYAPNAAPATSRHRGGLVKKGVATRSGTSPPMPTLRPAGQLDIR
jgi:Glycosyl transferases group 1